MGRYARFAAFGGSNVTYGNWYSGTLYTTKAADDWGALETIGHSSPSSLAFIAHRQPAAGLKAAQEDSGGCWLGRYRPDSQQHSPYAALAEHDIGSARRPAQDRFLSV